MAYGTSAAQGHHGRHLTRLEPGGADAEAGDDGRASTRRGSTCSTSRWPSLPVTRFLVRSPRALGGLTVRLAPRRPRARGRALLRRRRRRHLRGRPAQDRAAVPAGGLPPGAARGDRRHPVPAPGPRGLHRRPRGARSTCDAIAAPSFKLVVDYAYGATSLVMPNVLAKLGADVLAVNPYASTAGMIRFDLDAAAERVAGLVRASGAHLGAVFDPDGERLTLIDDEGPCSPTPRHCSPTSSWCAATCSATRIALPVNVTAHATSGWPSARRARCVDTKLSTAALMDAATEPGVGFAADGEGGFILPGFLARLRRRRRAREGARPAGPHRAAAVRGRGRAAAGPHGPRDRRDAVGPEGHGDALARGAWPAASSCSSTASRSLHDDGWVLALPDPEEPVTHVWAEGELRRRGAPAGPGVRPPDPADVALSRPAAGRRCRAASRLYVAAHERARGPPVLDGPRMGRARGRPGPDRHHRLRPGCPGRRRVRAGPEVGTTVTAGRDASARSSPRSRSPTSTRPSRARSSRSTTTLADAPERVNQDPYGDGLALRDRARRPGRARMPARRRRVPGARRGLRTAAVALRVLQPVRAPQPAGHQLLLVVRCGARLVRDDRTITFHPVDPLQDAPGTRRRRRRRTWPTCPSGCRRARRAGRVRRPG